MSWPSYPSLLCLAVACLVVTAGAPLVAEVYESPEDVQPLLIGSEVPSVEVLTLDGAPVDLREVIGKKKAVVIFYRGGWWPYCNAQLGELQSIESQIRAEGFELLAISADQPSKIQPTVAQHELGYTLYSDKTTAAAEAFGIAFKVDGETLATYSRYGIDLEAASGESHLQLPVPSVFIYRGGRMVFQYVNPNHRVRAPGEVILAAVRSAE